MKASPAPIAERCTVAVHVIVGFLGSGKTTLVHRLVAHARARGQGVALVVNDMAEADVDGALLHEAHGGDDNVAVMGLAGALLGAHRAPAPATAHVLDTTAGYVNSTFLLRKRVDLKRLEALLARFPKTLVRLKGFVFVAGDDKPRALQWTQGSTRLSAEPFSGDVESAYLAVIGRRISWDRFLDGLEKCLVRRARSWPRAHA